MKFEGTKNYISTDDLNVAVNAAIALEKPLLIKGEPGTGKTELARQISESMGLEIIEWNIKSTTKAQQGLYEYDAVSRLRDSQLGDKKIENINNYIKKGKIWNAFESKQRSVLLIDEIDKADIEFPNDLLQELDKMEFYVYETNQIVKANKRPIVIITSNNEKELPEAFLRRCFFHYIQFPDIDTLKKIVNVHFPNIKKLLLDNALKRFFEIRDVPGLKKKPSTKLYKKEKKSDNFLNKNYNSPKNKGSEIVKYQPNSTFSFSKFLSFVFVGVISIIGFLIILDTFKSSLYIFFPNLEFLLFSLYETLKDIELFVKDLF